MIFPFHPAAASIAAFHVKNLSTNKFQTQENILLDLEIIVAHN